MYTNPCTFLLFQISLRMERPRSRALSASSGGSMTETAKQVQGKKVMCRHWVSKVFISFLWLVHILDDTFSYWRSTISMSNEMLRIYFIIVYLQTWPISLQNQPTIYQVDLYLICHLSLSFFWVFNTFDFLLFRDIVIWGQLVNLHMEVKILANHLTTKQKPSCVLGTRLQVLVR